jgi:hypothetical protein
MSGVDQARECLAKAEAEAHRLGTWRNSVRGRCILVRARANVFRIQRRRERSNGLYEKQNNGGLSAALFVKSMSSVDQGDLRRARPDWESR